MSKLDYSKLDLQDALDIAILIEEEAKERYEELATQLEREGIDAFVEHWEGLPLFASQRALPDEDREALRRGRLTNDARSLAASLRGVGTGVLPSLWGDLEGIEMPVLLLVGALDAKFVEIGRRMAERLPHATLRVVEGAGHTVHRERSREWCGAVTDFLGESVTR